MGEEWWLEVTCKWSSGGGKEKGVAFDWGLTRSTLTLVNSLGYGWAKG